MAECSETDWKAAVSEANLQKDGKPSPSALQSRDENNNLEQMAHHECKTYVAIFEIVLHDWMYGYGDVYRREDYKQMLAKISEQVAMQQQIQFFLPGFPAKSSNKTSKVLGVTADFCEFLALRKLLVTARKIEAMYNPGVLITILSDFHTFDKFVFVDEADHNAYQKTLRTMVHSIGAGDVIQLISLAHLPEFKLVPAEKRSRKLLCDYGDPNFLSNFDSLVKNDTALREKYLGLKKFMLTDLAMFLPGSPNSKASRDFIKTIARGMMSQGIALDNFINSQTTVTNFIRLSIHNHHPTTGKNAVDLFKHIAESNNVLRTPWHHVVAFDTIKGTFVIDQKSNILALNGKDSDGLVLLNVQMDNYDWFYLILHLSDGLDKTKEVNFEAVMIKHGCGLIITNRTEDRRLKSDCIHAASLTNMIKQFGVVVLRGFSHFEDEKAFIDFYSRRKSQGLLRWNFGVLKKVKTDHGVPGFVNSNESLPIHFDFSNPPHYMAISQTDYRYKDYVCPEFVLYCRKKSGKEFEGKTTFVDAHAAVNSINGAVKKDWRNTTLSYETLLAKQGSKDVYFGGQGNIYEYPLVHRCPWTGLDVLRWGQSWTKCNHLEASQFVFVKVKSSQDTKMSTIENLEREIENLVFDERFFFAHAYQEEDQVYVNNYTMLHGREGYSGDRELWRLQALPSSSNLPAYLKNNH